MRAVLIAVALGLMPTFAEACSIGFDRRDGETEEAAAARWFRADEDRLWADSDVVFVGDVVGLSWVENDLMVEVRPRGNLKGDLESEMVVYRLSDDQARAVNCDRQSLPTVFFPGIFFARHGPNGELIVDGMLNYEDVRNPAVVARFFEVLEMDPILVRAPGLEPPWLAERWGWIAGGALLSFLGGVALGRRSRRNKNQEG